MQPLGDPLPTPGVWVWDGRCGHPAHLQACWEHFLGGPQFWPWGSLLPLVLSFSPSLLRHVLRGGTRISLPDRRVSVLGRWAPPGVQQLPSSTGSTGHQSNCVDKTRQGARPGVWGVDTLLHRSLRPYFLRGPSDEYPGQWVLRGPALSQP